LSSAENLQTAIEEKQIYHNKALGGQDSKAKAKAMGFKAKNFDLKKLEKLEVRLVVGKIKGFLYQN